MRPLLAALTVAALPALAATALAAFPGGNGRIAFESDRAQPGGPPDIWTINPDGSGPLNLTADSAGDDFSAAWSPDGEKIAFVRDTDGFFGPDDSEIWVMRADGSRQTQITDNEVYDLDPAWSPSGRRIVLARDPVRPDPDPPDQELWVIRADGSRERQLTDNETDDFEPAWPPDGRRIAFDRDTDPGLGAGAENFDVFDIRPDGSGERQLTDAEGFDGGPNYSPDGDDIAFDSERDGDPDVWVMERNGDDPEQLTGQEPDDDAVDILTAWSPDGRFIAFSSNRDDPESSEIYVMREDGSDETNRTNDPAFDFNPDWQPLDDDEDDDDDEEEDDD
jgi:Tol biopolymer transport system component